MNNKIPIIVAIGVAAVVGTFAVAFSASTNSSNAGNVTYIPKRILTLDTGTTIIPEAQAAENCGESIDSIRSQSTTPVLTPSVLPEGYALKATVFVPPDTSYLKFSDGPVCGGDGMKLKDGVVEIVEAPLSALTTEKTGADYIAQQLPKYAEKKMNAQEFELANGMKAIGYPAGVGTSRAIDENDVVVHTEEYDYPADIWAFDNGSESVYRITAFLPMEDMVRIAGSLKE